MPEGRRKMTSIGRNERSSRNRMKTKGTKKVKR